MLDLKYVCDNIELVKQALQNRSGNYSADKIVELADKRKILIKETEQLKAQKNAVSDKIALMKRNKENADSLIAEMKQEGDKIKAMETELNVIVDELKDILLNIPNIPSSTVPIGRDSNDNIEVRRFGEPRKVDFEMKAHWDLGEALGIFNWQQAGKITGARFTVYHGFGAKLERAIMNLMLDTHSARGYNEVFPPYMVNRESMFGTAQLPKFEEDMFAIKNTNYFLIPTAEVPVTNLHRDDILSESELPIKYCAYSACFRGEAGSAGRDTRGLIRQHQFNKVELVKFANPDTSYDELESLTKDAEKILQLLNLPYRVMSLCTGDIGFGSAKTYDIEVYMPSYGRYVEISSCSNYEDFQARRANIRFRDKNGKLRLVHTLNGSGLAIGRTVAAVIENYQNADGTITVPEVLRKYIGTDLITKK